MARWSFRTAIPWARFCMRCPVSVLSFCAPSLFCLSPSCLSPSCLSLPRVSLPRVPALLGAVEDGHTPALSLHTHVSPFPLLLFAPLSLQRRACSLSPSLPPSLPLSLSLTHSLSLSLSLSLSHTHTHTHAGISGASRGQVRGEDGRNLLRQRAGDGRVTRAQQPSCFGVSV